MENFKFFTDRAPLTPEEIHSHKNFNQVLDQYKNVPVQFYKTGWFKAGLATVTIVGTGTILFFATGPNKNSDPGTTTSTVTASPAPYSDETPCVKSPSPALDVPAAEFVINPSRDTVLRYETGSAIVYKANSLKDNSGNNVSGQVVIRYREFHNPVEIFASGIPMKYDSAGTDWHLKSAGMIELTAEQNGKPVFIAADKPIDVQMKSGEKGEFNLYYLDTVNRNWSFEGVNKEIAIVKPGEHKKTDPPKIDPSKLKPDTAKIRKEMATLLPVKPRQANPSSFTFSLDVLESEFPELSVYGQTKFEVIDDQRVFNNQVFSTEWEDAALKEIVKAEKYKMTLTRGNVVKSFTVAPVLEGKDYKLALEQYNKKYKDYQLKLEARMKEEKKKVEDEKKKLSDWEKEASEKHRLRIQDFTASNTPNAVLARFGGDNSSQALVTRAFTVSKFGIWNCDNPRAQPDGDKVMAGFFDLEGNPLPLTMAYLCEKNQNMMYTFTPEEFKKFRYNPKEKNIVWGVTADGKIAYGLEEVFAAENRKGSRIDFRLNVLEEKLATLKQVKELFGI